MTTYPVGYATPAARLTLAELETRRTWSKLDPEFRRRLLAFFDAAQAAGADLGLGGGWRSSEIQLATFLARHAVVPSGGCCSYNGRRYALKPGNAHAAPPGLSYHEETTPQGLALAADLIGDLVWANRNAARFGLVHFANVGNEPWHHQPTEIPTGRSRYKGEPLTVFALPGTPPRPPEPEDDDMVIITNSEEFFGGRPLEGKFLLKENGHLRHLGLAEWVARGSKPGIPWTNDQLSTAGFDS